MADWQDVEGWQDVDSGWSDVSAPVQASGKPLEGLEKVVAGATSEINKAAPGLSDLPLHEQAARLAGGLMPGIAETISGMLLQTPQMAYNVAGFANAVRQGKFSAEDYQKETEKLTPDWIKAIPQALETDPETYAGQLLTHGLGEGFKALGHSTGGLGAGLRATIEAALEGEGVEGARKRFSKYFKDIEATQEQLLNAGFLGKMGIDLAKAPKAQKAAPEAPTEAAKVLEKLKEQRPVSPVSALPEISPELRAQMENRFGWPDAFKEENNPPPQRFPEALEGEFPNIATAVAPGSLAVPAGRGAFNDADWETKNVRGAYPKIDPEFKTKAKEEPPVSEEYPPIENGFGWKDVEERPLENAPYMPGRLAEQANVDGMQGSHEMHLLDADVTAPAKDWIPGAGKKSTVEHPDTLYWGKNDAWMSDIRGATNVRDALGAVIKHSDDGALVSVAEKLLKQVRDVQFGTAKQGDHPKLAGNIGLYYGTMEGKQKVWVTDDAGVSPITVVHEARHAITEDAHAIAQDTGLSKKPQYKKQVEYSTEVERLRRVVEKSNAINKLDIRGQARKDLEYALTDRSEFDAQFAAVLEVRDLMKSIPDGGRTVFEKMKLAMYKLFGVKRSERSVFDSMILNEEKHIDSLQVSRGERGDYIKRMFDDGHEVLNFSKAMKDLGFTGKHAKDFEKRVQALSGFYKTPEELANFVAMGGKIEDISFRGDFIMNNQMAQRAVNNPVVSFTFNYLFDGSRRSEGRMVGYDKATEPSMKWAEKNWKESTPFFREWMRLNADPREAQTRAALEAGGLPAIKKHFTEKGVSPEAVDALFPLIEVMNDVHKSDSGTLGKINRSLKHEPLYFPLGRNGPYHFVLFDETGTVRYSAGFDTLRDAKTAAKDFKDIPEGWTLSEVERTDPSRAINSAMAQALLDGAPEWLEKIAQNQMSRRMEYIRRFERGRQKEFEVGGWLGEFMPDSPKALKTMSQEYIRAFTRRIRESHHLENATSAMEVSRALLENSEVRSKIPENTEAWLHTMLSRHIGLDVTAIPRFDKWLNRQALKVGSGLTKIDSILFDYKKNPNDNVFGPELAKEVLKQYSYLVSMIKIGLVPNVLLGNMAQNATISLDGARMAARLGVPQYIAQAALADSAAYMATFSKLDRHKAVKEFMGKSREEGVIDPKGREDYTTSQNPAERSVVQDRLDKVIQAPRNVIERGTNWNAILYYKFFFDRAFPEMEASLKERAIYNAARSFTGDYSQFANMFGFEKAGAMGALVSNFARWRFNRTSRLLDDIVTTTEGSKYGAAALAPLLITVATGSLFAGLYGTAGLVEYEAIRRFGTKLGLFDLQPLSSLIGDTGLTSAIEKKFGPNSRTFVERGGLTAFSDSVAQQFGQATGPDLSGSIRESSVLEMPGVAVSYGIDLAKAGSVGVKGAVQKSGIPDFVRSMDDGFMKDVLGKVVKGADMGITNDDRKAVVKALPNPLQELFKDKVFGTTVKIPGENGTTRYGITEDKKNQVSFIRNEFQQNLALMGGLKTTEETNFNEGKQYHKWTERQAQAELTNLREGILANYEDTALVSRNGARILKDHGKQALESTIEELVNVQTKKTKTDYFGLESLAAMNKRDNIAIARAVERLKAALAVARRPTSSGR